jgi:hypothetical protein
MKTIIQVLLFSLYCKGQTTINSIAIDRNGMLNFNISKSEKEHNIYIQKKEKGIWRNIGEVQFGNASINIPSKVETYIFTDSLLIPLDSGTNKFRIEIGSEISEEVSLNKPKETTSRIIMESNSKIIWNDWDWRNPLIYSTEKMIRFNEPQIYFIYNTEGQLVKDDFGKFIDFSALKKGAYYLTLNGQLFMFNNK